MHLISFKFFKYLFKNLLQSRGPYHLPLETDVMSFSCFSFFTAVCFASSSANTSCFQLCLIMYNVPSHSPLICLCLSCNQKSQSLQTDIGNCFEGSDVLLSLVIRQFFWSWVAYYFHKHNYLWRLAVVFGVWEAAWYYCDIPHCFGISCHAVRYPTVKSLFLAGLGFFLLRVWFLVGFICLFLKCINSDI